MTKPNFVSLPGRLRPPPRGIRSVGGADPARLLRVSVFVRRRQPLDLSGLASTMLPQNRIYFSHLELATAHGGDPKDLAAVDEYVRSCGLKVIESNFVRRRMVVEGKVAQLEGAFDVGIVRWEHDRGVSHGCTGPVRVPATLAGVVTGVFGLDDRPVAVSHLRRLKKKKAAAPSFAGYTGEQVARFYDFPTGVDGTGQVIGIIELGGGFRAADLSTYFTEIGVPLPAVTAVAVGTGTNDPTTAEGADGEVMLDIEVAGAVAPGAKIVVYFAAGATDQDFLDVFSYAVHDTTNNPGVLSISWGGPESAADASFQTQFDEILQSAAALGITVTAASGDSGAADEPPSDWDGKVHVDFPASSPNVLACGATSIQVSGTTVTAESIWNEDVTDMKDDSFGASGGGISEVFPVPAYQAGLSLPPNASTKGTGRGVPDVAGDGDPATGYRVRVDGQEFPVGGTSAVAPLWAGLVALLNQKLGHRAGLLNALLYANPSALQQITTGNNEVGTAHLGYVARPGWNACSGLGRPVGTKVLAVLQG